MASRRYRRSGSSDVVAPIIILAIIAHAYGFTIEAAEKALTLAVAVLFGVVLLIMVVRWLRRARYRRELRAAKMDQIDAMSGLEFEQYVAELLKRRGFTDVRLTERFDWGVDIIATKGGVQWGVQTKRSARLVKVAAVRQVIAGLSTYGCKRGMVVTNGTFSRPAEVVAKANHCVLIDRPFLAALIRDAGSLRP